MISIIIPTRNEEKFIFKLLNSLCSYNAITEIIIVDGLSTDKTKEQVLLFQKNINRADLKIKIIDNPKLLQGYALNLGISHAQNEIITRIDAHSLVNKMKGKDFFNDLSKKLKSNKYAMIGFKQRFMYDSFFQASLFLLSFTNFLSKSSYRFTNKAITTFDTAWLFCASKKDAKAINLFNPDATPNEDYDFCQRIIFYKKKPILIYPDFPIYYAPRKNIISLAKQYFKYGNSRASTYYRLKKTNKKKLILRSLVNTLVLLSSLIIALIVLVNLKVYLFILIIILSSFIYFTNKDNLTYTEKNNFNKRLILGLIISPYVAFIPLIFRTIGQLNFTKNALLKK